MVSRREGLLDVEKDHFIESCLDGERNSCMERGMP